MKGLSPISAHPGLCSPRQAGSQLQMRVLAQYVIATSQATSAGLGGAAGWLHSQWPQQQEQHWLSCMSGPALANESSMHVATKSKVLCPSFLGQTCAVAGGTLSSRRHQSRMWAHIVAPDSA